VNQVRTRWLALSLLTVPLLAAGCTDLQYFIPAVNCTAPPLPEVVVVEEHGRAARGTLAGVDDAQWLQVARQSRPGVIGGYLSPEPGTRGSLVLLLSGASTSYADARVAAVLSFFRGYGDEFRRAGFRLWAPVLSEGGPYATDEVDDVVEVLEWLDSGGLELLSVDRVFVVGYSTGATTANFVNLRAKATAVVSLAGLTEPEQLQRNAVLYHRITDLFPCTTGMLQFRRTLDHYDAVGWDEFNVVARVAEMRNPALFMTAADDIIYEPANVRNLQAAYEQALAAGAMLPELTFEYVPSGGHFAYVQAPELFDVVVRYLEQFEVP